jgi:hypothetical protein
MAEIKETINRKKDFSPEISVNGIEMLVVSEKRYGKKDKDYCKTANSSRTG